MNLLNSFLGVRGKAQKLMNLREKLGLIEEEKSLIANNYTQFSKLKDISKSVSNSDYFTSSGYLYDIASLKNKERKIKKEIESLEKSIESSKNAEGILKSLYRAGKISIEQYGEIRGSKTKDGRVQYSDVIVLNTLGELLLLKRSEWEDNHKGAWVIPGGHVDGGETAEQAAKRELLEESGISVDKFESDEFLVKPVFRQVAVYEDKKAQVNYFLLEFLDPKSFEILLDENESRDYKWIKREEIDNYPMVFNMQANVKKILQWDEAPQIKLIQKAITFGLDPEFGNRAINDLIEKAKKAQVGEIRIWSGKKVQKQPDKTWKEITEKVTKLPFEPNPDLSLSDKEVEKKFINYLESNLDKAVSDYEKEFGNILGGDNAKELSEDYISDKMKYGEAAHEPSSAFVKYLYEKKLSNPPDPDKDNMVIFTAGGSGAGKTSGITNFGDLKSIQEKAEIVYDTTMSSFFSAKKKIKQALDKGRKVTLLYTYREPVDAFINGVVPRCIKTGRPIPYYAHSSNHIGARDTVLKLSEEFNENPNFYINFIDNSNGLGNAKLMDYEQVKEIKFKPEEEYRAEILSHLNKMKDENRITEKQYRGLVGSKSSGSEEEISKGNGEDLYRRIPEEFKQEVTDSIKKAFDYFERGLIDKDTLLKSMKNLSHLVPKRVQVKGKDGKTHQAIRWVNPETGDSEKVASPKQGVDGADFAEKMNNVINDDSLKKADKVRNIFNLGVFDSSIISLLTGVGKSDVNWYLKKDSNIDVSTLNDKTEEAKRLIAEDQEILNGGGGREETKILRSIPIERVWDFYRSNLKRVAQGRHKFAIAYGTGGVGKTFEFEQLAKQFELREFDEEIQPSKGQYDYVVVKGKITPTQVYAEMYRHRDKLIVFDDCDSFLSTEEVQGFLKGGLDTGQNTKISNKSSRKTYLIDGDKESGEIPSTFSFTGRVIAITNLTSSDIDQAVFSRALCSNLSMTVDETIEKLGKIKYNIKVWSADKTEVIEVDKKSRDIGFELIKKNKDRLGGAINTRTYMNTILIVDTSLKEGLSEDYIEQEVENYYDSVTGDFDRILRNIKPKK